VETDKSRLVHMYESVRRIQHYANGGRGAFMGSPMVQDAILWNLQLVSTAASRLSDECKEKHPEVDWRRVGNPWRPEAERIWARLESELDSLRSSVQTILSSELVRH
jgi:uncharacterized protein with HEPN domain